MGLVMRGRSSIELACALMPLRNWLLALAVGGLVACAGCGGGGGGPGVPRRGDVQGRVVDDGSLVGVVGASVAINGQNVATTGAGGEFSAQNVPAGDVTFQISHGSYSTLTEDRYLDPNQNTDLRSQPFFLPPALAGGEGIVSGYIRDGSGSPAAGATITVTPRSNPALNLVGISRTDGTFRVYKVPAGIADLVAQGTGGQAWSFGFTVPSGSSVDVGTLTLSNSPPPPPFPQPPRRRPVGGS